MLLALAGVLLSEGSARAEPAEADAHAFHRLGVTFNLLGPLNSTYQGSVEWLVTARDSLTLAPWYAKGHAESENTLHIDFNYAGSKTYYRVDFAGEGLDVQYRHYFGGWYGGNGPFIAPGLDMALFQVDGTTTDYTMDVGEGPPARLPGQRFAYVGPTADLGIQAAVAWGLTFGGSLGVRYRFVMGDLDRSALPYTFDTAHGPGFGARVRAWVGWSFL
jgi:hypothetical protein